MKQENFPDLNKAQGSLLLSFPFTQEKVFKQHWSLPHCMSNRSLLTALRAIGDSNAGPDLSFVKKPMCNTDQPPFKSLLCMQDTAVPTGVVSFLSNEY